MNKEKETVEKNIKTQEKDKTKETKCKNRKINRRNHLRMLKKKFFKKTNRMKGRNKILANGRRLYLSITGESRRNRRKVLKEINQTKEKRKVNVKYKRSSMKGGVGRVEVKASTQKEKGFHGQLLPKRSSTRIYSIFLITYIILYFQCRKIGLKKKDFHCPLVSKKSPTRIYSIFSLKCLYISF